MGCGRFICVLLPIALTVASIVSILIVCLAGITNKSLYLFEVTTANFSASPSTLENLAHEIFRREVQDSEIPGIFPRLADQNGGSVDVVTKVAATVGGIVDAKAKFDAVTNSEGGNITAKTLELADKYKVSIWNYCRVTGDESTCIEPKYNWAAVSLNTSDIESRATQAAGSKVTLPNEIDTALSSFVNVSKWTQLFYVIALISGGIELVFGFIAIYSRAGSCLSLFISGVATITVIIASILATAQASVVTATLNSAAKAYDVKSKINTSFLATTWLAVAFSIGAGLFWAVTSCCCAGGNSTGRRRSNSYVEKPRSNIQYQRMNEP
ncbi:putative integral membrane protein [Erysiphe neolycopersici]|uniref:Putative integral membrane protein n=1 Tax=Erysiphe neolycopersici TaxID=212602 RepID=A0A420HUC4_9PEZI|nr:putative integral membrane protein [Erysiphe neolycopersici]